MLQLGRHHRFDAGATPLQGQAHEIIVSILDDPSPGLDGVKERLTRCLAAHPHAPEMALLEHLRETVKIVNAEPGQ
ncbi:hypothetical protein [Pseudarthrobacter sp. IC2-21]|jgi:hypothetical protein|nr:hypothetical protein [Pseudarthrobacter sp. IC2-21]